MRTPRRLTRTATATLAGVLGLALVAGCSGGGSSRAVQAASQASAAAAAQCPGDKQADLPYGSNNAPISAKSVGSQAVPKPDLLAYTVAGFGSWFAIGGADTQWRQGNFAPARLERVAQKTAQPIVSAALDAHAVGASDTTATNPASAYDLIDGVVIGSKAIYATWLQYADKKLTQTRLVALDRCTLTVMASAELSGNRELYDNQEMAYDQGTNSIWVAADNVIKRFDGTTLAPLPDVDAYARSLADAGGVMWASTGGNDGTVVKIDPKTGTSTPVPALSTGDQSIARVQHAGDQVYVAMNKQLVQVNPDGTAGKTWPLTGNLGALVAGTAAGDTWVLSTDGLHALTSGATLSNPGDNFQILTVTSTDANVWAVTSDFQLVVWAS